MRKHTFTCLRLLLLLTVPAEVHAQPAQPSAGKHSLWKVQGKSTAVYLLGSVHVLKKEDYPLPTPLEAAFSNSAIVAFETDIDAMEKPEVMMKMATKGMLPAGQTLHDQLSPAVYASFSNHVQKTGMPVAMFESFAPAMAAIALVALELRKMDLDPEQGLDKHFFAEARQREKKIVPLETIDFQIGLLTGFTRDEGELMMKSTLKDLDTMEKDFTELLTAWKTGNSGALEKLLNEAMEEAPVIYKRMVTDRNVTWLPRIEEWLNGKDPALVVVGAGHLVGKNGVIELLKKKGYRVTQE